MNFVKGGQEEEEIPEPHRESNESDRTIPMAAAATKKLHELATDSDSVLLFPFFFGLDSNRSDYKEHLQGV